jgi:hypothetical protein
MASVVSQTFADVEVHVPAGQTGEANFVKLTTGRLQVDENLAITMHTIGGKTEPKNLGFLYRASAILDDNAGRSLDVKMSNRGSVDLYRFLFRSTQDAGIVASLADKAMEDEFNTWEASTTARNAEHDHLMDAVKKSLGWTPTAPVWGSAASRARSIRQCRQKRERGFAG